MVATIHAWRIAADTPAYGSDALTGDGARSSGGRWNRKGTPMVYSSTNCALACLEVLAHLSGDGLPLNRYLVRIEIPLDLWKRRVVFDRNVNVGWDARPVGLVSLDWGTQWAQAGTSVLAEVPSVIVPEESNILINSQHPNLHQIAAIKVRRWEFDLRHVLIAGVRGKP